MKSKERTDFELYARIAELELLIKQTDVLFSIAEAGIKSTNLPELLTLIAGNIVQGTLADRVAMITLDLAEQKIDHFVRGGSGGHNIDLSVSYAELMEGLSGWAIQNKQSAISPKNKPDARESAAVQQRRRETNCGSIIVTPVLHDDEVLGTITVINNPRDRDFTMRDVLLIEAAAGEAAAAIVKASLYQELEQANQSLRKYALELEGDITERQKTETRQAILYETLQAVGKHLDVTVIAKSAIETLARLSPWTSVAISLLDADGKTWKTIAGSGKTIGQYGQPRSVDQGVIGRAYRTGQIQQVSDISADPDYFQGKETRSQSELAVPIKHNEIILGVLNIESDTLNDFDNHDISLAESLTDAISLAMANAYQYAKTQSELNERKHAEEILRRQNHYFTALHKITLDLINRREADDLLQSIVDQAAEFLDAPFCEIMLNEGDELVVKAFTRNQPLLAGDRIKRNEALLSWQAFDTCAPAVINDYSQWAQHRAIYDSLNLSAVVALPILLEGGSIGVLDISRSETNYIFDDSDIQAATLFAQLAALAMDNARLHEALRQESIRDALTGLFNRRFMEETLTKELSRTQRKSQSLVIVIFDLDHLKEINDTFGHSAGDDALVNLGLLLKAKIRVGDIACRYGGDEFIVILPEAQLEDVYQRMDEFRKDVKQITIRHGEIAITPLTISAGIAEYPLHGETREMLLKAADKALYKAKQAGRNQIMIA